MNQFSGLSKCFFAFMSGFGFIVAYTMFQTSALPDVHVLIKAVGSGLLCTGFFKANFNFDKTLPSAEDKPAT